MTIQWKDDQEGERVYADDTVENRLEAMKTLLKEVLRLPVHLEDDDAKLLYSSMHGHAARGSGVTIRAIAEVSYQDGDQTMFHGTIRFDDNKDTTQRTAIVAWPLDNARPAPWTNDHVGNEEIILFWTASARPGGNLGLCAHNLNAIEHLVKAHLVCEVVFSQNTRWWAFTWIELGKALPSLFRTFPSVHEAAGATGVLLGVELGEVSVSQQSDLQKLLGGYSFFDGTLGMVSLLMLILLINGLFGVYLTDEEGSVLLIVLTIAVVALLHEEATWPWIFSRIIRCARIDTPIERVNKLKHVKYTDAPFSGQAILSAGLGFLVLWMDIGSEEHIIRTATFRVAASSFAAVMTGVLLLNMVQAVLTAPADTETPECWVKTSITTLYVPLKPVGLPTWFKISILVTLFLGACAFLFIPLAVRHAWASLTCLLGCVALLTLAAIAGSDSVPRFEMVKATFWNTLACVWWCLLSSCVGVTFVFASMAAYVAFSVRAVFDIAKRARVLLFGRVFFALLRICGGVFRSVDEITTAGWSLLLLINISIPVAMVYGGAFDYAQVLSYCAFAVITPDVVYLLLTSALLAVDCTLSLVSDVRLMPMMSAYGGSLAWNMGAESVEIVYKPMVDMIVEESTRLGVGGYEYLRGVKGYNRVPRVGQRAVVMLTDFSTTTTAVASLTCNIRGKRSIT